MPFDVAVEGILGDAGNARGAYPVRIVSNMVDAIDMRFGNTLEELGYCEWQPYEANALWFIPTGVHSKQIYVEFRLSDNTVVSDVIEVPALDSSLGTDYPWPVVPIVQSGTVAWNQTFDIGRDYWSSYDFTGGVPGEVNVFYPTSWTSKGGVDDTGYIWSDDSRWRIDTPEVPEQVFAFEIRGEWVDPAFTLSDFDGYTASFYLKGDNLDLKGGSAFFWIMDDHGRAINVAQLLEVGDGTWAFNQVYIGSVNDDDWHVSYLPQAGLIDPSAIRHWGITFEGFHEEPTGIIGLDNFSIEFIPVLADPNGPIKSGSQITVKRNTDGEEANLVTSAFENGGSVAVWQDATGHVYAQLMHADGSKFGARLDVATNADDPTVAALANGSFIVAWQDMGDSVETAPSIAARLYDRAGTLLSDFALAPRDQALDVSPSIAALGSGAYVVVWTRDPDGGDQGYDVYARLFGGDGAPLDAEFALTTSGTVQGRPVVTGLSSGAFLVAWSDAGADDEVDGSGTHIRAQLILEDGTVADSFIVNSTSEGDPSGPVVAALPDQGFLVAWLDASDDASGFVRARAFDMNGNALGPDFLVNESEGDPLDDLSAIGLPNGEFVITWTQRDADGAKSDVHARIMSADGQPITDDFVLNFTTAGLGVSDNSSVTLLSDGRMMASWIEHAGSWSTVRAQVFDQRVEGATLIGTGADDDWIGSPFGDSMFGGSGNNRMAGGLGDDWYYVTSASDIIIEKPGQGENDRILVSFNYTLAKRVDVEALAVADAEGTNPINLTGNEIANALFGNDGNNILDGGGASNTLIGRKGDDRYFINDADDTVVEQLGEGLDRVFARVSYTLSPGAEIEILATGDQLGTQLINLTGNELFNLLAGNAGNNILDGGGGGRHAGRARRRRPVLCAQSQ